jgi:hypothetical protein
VGNRKCVSLFLSSLHLVYALSCYTIINPCQNFHLVRLLAVRHFEMLFNVCGSQGPEILCGNWEVVGVPSSVLQWQYHSWMQIVCKHFCSYRNLSRSLSIAAVIRLWREQRPRPRCSGPSTLHTSWWAAGTTLPLHPPTLITSILPPHYQRCNGKKWPEVRSYLSNVLLLGATGFLGSTSYPILITHAFGKGLSIWNWYQTVGSCGMEMVEIRPSHILQHDRQSSFIEISTELTD